MRALPTLVLSLLVALATAPADAAGPAKKKLYRWTDAKGEVHYTDALPPEAAADARDTLNRDGRAVDRTDRAPTEEERVAQQAEAERLAAEKKQQEDAAKMDAVLVASYPAEADLARAYKERFDLIEQMGNILLSSGEKIVEANNFLPLGQKPFAQMRADEPGSAGD